MGSGMTNQDLEKKIASEYAVGWVRDGMIVGLGSGSTAAHAVRALARRMKSEGLMIEGIPTSKATEALARELRIPLTSFDVHPAVDLTIDGADEIDGKLRAIKGGGGAFLREKIVAAASKRMAVVVDSSKVVERLGREKLPLEVIPMALRLVLDEVRSWGVEAWVRETEAGTPYVTDQGNYIVDAVFGSFENVEQTAARLDAIPGILAHGLFLREADVLVIGRGDQVEVHERP
jgi:ribose 5-phosphate isomerase A